MARTLANLTNGILAGAAATLARELVSNLDVVVRARPMSNSHERTVQRLMERAQLSLGPEDRAANRRAGLGPLLGFANGVLTVALFATVTARRRPAPPVAVGLIGLGGMLVADGPMAALGVTNPRRWRARDWFEDALPYVAYSLTAVATLTLLDRATAPARRR
ncbi:hypothetical protein OG792_15550 [Micromonospora sp. NBC_01699]|uniref:hypothetical protein n=1 Tax=Micromonospora sp. NBC_01699 TaxID=2975984 RepID=UPI002E3466A8|nr:hypothetical protein [Micromonospora sp. NBC_01699]